MKKYSPFLLAVILAALLSDGNNGGDEGEVYGFVQAYFEGHSGHLWDFLTTAAPNGSYLQHHFFWFLLQFAEAGALNAITGVLGFGMGDELRRWVLVFPLVMMASLAAPVAYRALRRHEISTSMAQLCLCAFFLGGSVTGLLTGGFIECYLLLAIAMRLSLLAPRKDGNVPIVPLTLVDWTLVAAKSYSLVFLVVMLPDTLRGLDAKDRWKYLASLSFLCSVWFALKGQIPADGIAARADLKMPPISFGGLMSNLSSATFGFTFGLIWTTPILMLAGLPKDAWRPELAVKLSAIVALEVVFCLFPFWHGATGIPGQRYILPYLVILLPEMCAGLAGLVARSRAFLLAPVACTVLFLPALDFRNTFADSYPPAAMQGQSRIEFGLEHFPVADWSFHPGMFAWRLVIARLSGDATFPSALSGGPLLNPSAVIPMTGISRIIDAVNAPAIHDDPRFDRVRKIFSGWPARLLELVRGGLALGLMVALVNIAYRLGRQTRTTGKIVPS